MNLRNPCKWIYNTQKLKNLSFLGYWDKKDYWVDSEPTKTSWHLSCYILVLIDGYWWFTRQSFEKNKLFSQIMKTNLMLILFLPLIVERAKIKRVVYTLHRWEQSPHSLGSASFIKLWFIPNSTLFRVATFKSRCIFWFFTINLWNYKI